MEQVKEIEQLKKREQVLENVQFYQKENLKRDVGPYALALAAISGLLGITLLISMFFGKRA
jgi:hypothetical protein